MTTERHAEPWGGPGPRQLAKLAALFAAALVLWLGVAERARAADEPGAPGARGSVAQIEPIGAYSALRLKVLLLAAGLQARVTKGTHLYRVSYWSVTDGAPVLVSGLMTVPDGVAPRGTVVWMHGTHDARADSLSNPGSEEGLLASALFAGGGYLVLAPDLVGLGVSKGPQAYFVNASTVDVTFDFLRAAKGASAQANRPWNANLYLTGFSEGGHAAALLQRALEQHPDPAWHVVAGAGIAGPYRLADISFPFALNGRSPGDSDYLATVSLSYATYYHRPLDSVLAQPYAQSVAQLFDGDHSLAEIAKAMPSNPRLLFTPEVLAAFDGKGSDWFVDALRANQIDHWAPRAPFRAYFGDNDVDVSPADAKALVADAKALGGEAEAISVGPYDHGGSALHAAPLIRQWFDQLSAGAASGPS
ncbi:MAG TPA: hypothetical protein VN805_01980 [Caulobacteraceae bacterium]|nr:hypothetical protein [Caulobacteraceae bacterium]